MNTDTSERKFTARERRALREVARNRLENWPDRRSVLAGLGGLSIAAAGLAPAAAATDASPRQPSTGDELLNVASDTTQAASAGVAQYLVCAADGAYHAVNPISETIDYSHASDLGPVLQYINDHTAAQLHVHIMGRRAGGPPAAYDIYTPVTWDTRSLLVTGGGKNKTSLRLGDGANTDLFVVNPDTTGAIVEFQNLKFYGNKAENTSGNGVRVGNANEIGFHHCELRSWPERAVWFDTPAGVRHSWWNSFVNTWVLDNEGGGIEVDRRADGGHVEELSLVGCLLSGGNPASADPGKPALRVTEANGDHATYIGMSGGTLKGADVVDIRGGSRVHLTGVQGRHLGGSYTLRAGAAGESVYELSVQGCDWYGGGSGENVTNHIRLGDCARNVRVRASTLKGQTGDAIDGVGRASWEARHDIVGWKLTGHGQDVISSGTTATTGIEHGLAETPSPEDFSLDWNEDPGSAKVAWVDGITASQFDLNVDADPGKDLTINWQVDASVRP